MEAARGQGARILDIWVSPCGMRGCGCSTSERPRGRVGFILSLVRELVNVKLVRMHLRAGASPQGFLSRSLRVKIKSRSSSQDLQVKIFKSKSPPSREEREKGGAPSADWLLCRGFGGRWG